MKWFLMVGFLTSICQNKFLCLFHSTRVCILPHSLSKKIETHACGMYVTSMDHILFTLSCCAPIVHTKSTFEKGECIGFWTLMECDFGRCLMLEMEICQIHVGKPPLQCYGSSQKNTIIFQLRPYIFSCINTFITQSTMC